MVTLLTKSPCKTSKSTQDTPKSSYHHKGDLFAPERPRAGYRGQRQETKEEREGKGTNERVRGICPRGLPLDREDTDMAHRKITLYKGTRGNPV